MIWLLWYCYYVTTMVQLLYVTTMVLWYCYNSIVTINLILCLFNVLKKHNDKKYSYQSLKIQLKYILLIKKPIEYYISNLCNYESLYFTSTLTLFINILKQSCQTREIDRNMHHIFICYKSCKEKHDIKVTLPGITEHVDENLFKNTLIN